jgi:hypothetical protein
MVTAFANNQVIVAEVGTPSTIYTDPVSLNGNDRGWAILNVHYIFGGSTSRQLASTPEVSNDGVNWVDGAAAFTAAAAGLDDAGPFTLYAAQLRFKFVLTIVGGSGVGAVCFDLHMTLDKA